MSDFAIVSELIETTVTKSRIRSPGIHFSNSVSGEQFISVDLTEVKEVNNEVKEEIQLDKIVMSPMELASTQLISPVDGLPIEVDGAPLILDLQYVLAVLYTVFRVAASKRGIDK